MVLTATGRLESALQFIVVLILFLFVCALTYFGTRFIATFQKGQMNCTNIDVVETFRIAPNKYIQIVRIADEYVAICICKDTVTFLTKVDEDKLDLTGGSSAMKTEFFSEILEKAKKKVMHHEGKRECK